MIAFLAEHIAAELGLLAGAIYVTAVVMAVDAVMKNRTAQGAIAWAVSLSAIPILAPPLYLIFGLLDSLSLLVYLVCWVR